MLRRWRAITVLLTLALIVTGPAAALAATDGDGDHVTDRTSDRVTDRIADRVVDRETDRVRDRITDRITDRVTDRPLRPQCDRDPEADRPIDCRRKDRPTDHLRPWLARCINWVTHHTDIRTQDSLRFWWHLCHRLAWNHAHPV